MGIKKQKQIKLRQGLKRRKERRALRGKGLNPDDFFSGKYYVRRMR